MPLSVASITGRVPGIALLLALLAPLAGCAAERSYGPYGVRRVTIVLDGDTIRPGQQRLARAVATGRTGEIVDAPVAWRSLTPTTLAVGPNGEVLALAPGVGILRATVGNAVDERRVELVNPPAVFLRVQPESLTLVLPGAAVLPAVTARDALGEPIVGATFSWSSDAPRIATVSANGEVAPTAVGRTTLRVALDGIVEALPVAVLASGGAAAPAIDSVRPATITPGVPFTVHGTRLATSLAAPALLVDGWPAQVLATGTTQLTAVLTAPVGACEPSGPAAVQVTTDAGVGAGTVGLEIAPRRTLGIGAAALLLNAAEAGCVELLGEGRYLVTVLHAARAIGAGSIAATLDVRSGRSGAAPLAITYPAASLAVEPPSPHLAVLEASRAYAPGAGVRSAATLQLPPVGGLTAVRVPDLDDPRLCVGFRPITARTVYNGTRIAILEDTSSLLSGTATLAGQMDAWITEVGAEVDAVTWPLIERFGNPLVMDERLDANGKVILVVTSALNAMRGGAVRGAVVSCDFFPRGSTPASNVGEMLYLQVPDLADAPSPDIALERWRAATRGTIAHELKHVVGFAERIARGQPLEESWLEEATARHSEELFTRALTGITAGADAGYDRIRCEALAALGDLACQDTPTMMRPALEGLYGFLDAPALHSPLGSIGGDESFYGSAWSLLRWTLDHTAGDEAAFTRALTVSGQAGIANLEARAGRSWDEILARWALAVSTDARAGIAPPLDATLRYPSWKLGELFAGFCGDIGGCAGGDVKGLFGRAHPLRPLVVTEDVSARITEIVPAGFAAFDLTAVGAGRTRLLQLRGVDGAPLAGTARLAILRIE